MCEIHSNQILQQSNMMLVMLPGLQVRTTNSSPRRVTRAGVDKGSGEKILRGQVLILALYANHDDTTWQHDVTARLIDAAREFSWKPILTSRQKVYESILDKNTKVLYVCVVFSLCDVVSYYFLRVFPALIFHRFVTE